MDATTPTSQTAVRWTMVATLAFVCALFIRGVLGGVPPEPLHTLGLIIVALAAYAWVLYPVWAGALVSLVILGCLSWA